MRRNTFPFVPVVVAVALQVGCGAEGEPVDRLPADLLAPEQCAGTAVRATIELSATGPVLLGAALVDVEVASLPGALEVLSADGQLVATAAVPELASASIIAPPGEDDGDGVALGREVVSVVAPWPAGADSLRLGAVEIAAPECADWLGKADGTRVEPELVRGAVSARGRFDLVILGDGYRTGQLGTFRSDALRAADAMLAQEPYRTYRSIINVWRLPLASDESGAGTGQAKDTAHGCYYGCHGLERLICCDTERVLEVAQASVPSFDALVMVVNDARYGGAGDATCVSAYNGEHMAQVVAHELGHQLGLLDEYTYVGFSGFYPAKINCSASSSETPWEPWSDVAGIGAFSGCGAPAHFRPTADACLMKTLGKATCPVCTEHLVKQVVTKAGTLAADAWPPPGMTVTIGSSSQTFRVEPATPTVVVEWLADDTSLDAHGNLLTLSACTYHELTARLTDHTALVRNDPDHALTTEVSWTLECE